MVCGDPKLQLPQLNMEGAMPEQLLHAVCTADCGCTHVATVAMPPNFVPYGG